MILPVESTRNTPGVLEPVEETAELVVLEREELIELAIELTTLERDELTTLLTELERAELTELLTKLEEVAQLDFTPNGAGWLLQVLREIQLLLFS